VRNKLVGIRLTPVERQLLEAAARRDEMRLSTFCREVLVDLARSMLVADVLDFEELEKERES
jgi:uncharacterized protein (DUF1778 family)